MLVSLFKDAFTTTPVNCELTDVLSAIQSGRWMNRIYQLRAMDKEVYDKEKLFLPAVTFNGVFAQRLDKEVVQYTGLMIIDIDHLDPSQVVPLKQSIAADLYTHCIFVSPSGKGLKILFKINNQDPSKHKVFFAAIQKHFEEKYAISIDKSGKNVSRLCFISYDPDLYFNDNSQVFDAPGIFEHFQSRHYRPVSELKNYNSAREKDVHRSLELSVKWVEKHYAYIEGQRNIFIHAVACAMNRIGIDMEDCSNELCAQFDLDQDEIKKAVKSAYFHNRNEFSTYNPKSEKEFVKPLYTPNYTDDVVKNNIIEMITKVYTGETQTEDLISITGRYARSLVQDGFIQMSNEDIAQLITDTVNHVDKIRMESAETKAMKTENIMNIGDIYAQYSQRRGGVNLGISFFDEFDILIPGNFYGIIGMPETFKSVFAYWLAIHNAKSGVPALIFNGEMSRAQVFERTLLSETGINMRNPVNKERAINDPDWIGGMGTIVNAGLYDNLQIVTDTVFTQEGIISTVEMLRVKHKKDIKIIIIDGITAMDWLNREEAPAAIYNSLLLKDIATETNTCVIAMYHTAGNCRKHFRQVLDWVRGGQKVQAKMDGIFMTSLVVHPDTNLSNNNDVMYYHNQFYLRYQDKRGGLGTLNAIVGVDERLRLSYISDQVNNYEVKIDK